MWGTTYRESYEQPSKVGLGSIEASDDESDTKAVRPDPHSPSSALGTQD
jgi:hypothetical protein